MAFGFWKIGKKAFSLIEVSIFIVILLLLLTAIVGLSGSTEDQEAIDVTQQKLDRIEKAIIAYQNLNGHIPCPASRTEAPSSANFGTATDCSLASATGTDEYSTGSTAVRIGAAPTRTLGLPDDVMFDGWKNRFTFAVIKNLAQTDDLFDSYSGTNYVISVIDSSGTEIGQPAPSQIAYVLVSHGQNGNGAYNYQGSSNFTCVASINDEENCDSDAVFRAQKSDYNSGTYYDDFLRYKTFQVIKKLGGYKTWGSGNIIKYALFYDRATSGNQDSGSDAGSSSTLTDLGFGTEITNTTNTVTHSTLFGGSIVPTSEYGKYLIRHSSVGCGVNAFHGTFLESVSTNRTPGQAVYSDSTSSPLSCNKSDSTYYGSIATAQDLKAELYIGSDATNPDRGQDPSTALYFFYDSFEVWELDR